MHHLAVTFVYTAVVTTLKTVKCFGILSHNGNCTNTESFFFVRGISFGESTAFCHLCIEQNEIVVCVYSQSASQLLFQASVGPCFC